MSALKQRTIRILEAQQKIALFFLVSLAFLCCSSVYPSLSFVFLSFLMPFPTFGVHILWICSQCKAFWRVANISKNQTTWKSVSLVSQVDLDKWYWMLFCLSTRCLFIRYYFFSAQREREGDYFIRFSRQLLPWAQRFFYPTYTWCLCMCLCVVSSFGICFDATRTWCC